MYYGSKLWNSLPSDVQRPTSIQCIPRNMHTVFDLLCFVVVIHWLIFPYPSGLLHWHCGNLTIAPVPAKQPWWIWINNSCEFIMNDCITTIKQSTTKPCAYFLGYTVYEFCGKVAEWCSTVALMTLMYFRCIILDCLWNALELSYQIWYQFSMKLYSLSNLKCIRAI